jgi:hypothetical protein
MLKHFSYACLKIHLRFPAEHVSDLINIGEGTIWLTGTMWDVDDISLEQFHEHIDTVCLTASDIEDLSYGIRVMACQKTGVRNVRDKGKIAGLRPVSNHSIRFGGEFLRQEHTENSSVRA